MTFSDRIVFLMELTSTTNKQLADAAKVDPSLISLIRTGRREPSKNNTYVRALSDFFSAKCTENYQRIALSEAIGNKNLQPGMDKKQLSSIIFDWLTDNRDSVGTLMSTFERSVLEEYPAQTPLGPVEAPPKVTSNCFSFFGNEGKRSAINTFINHLSRLSEPGTILLYTDESSEYLFEEPVYLPKLEGKIMHLLRKGFKIRRITGLISSADQAFFSLTRWLPLYMTGHVESFYYPRLRDNLLRRTLIVMPNVGAVISNSTEGQKNSRTTLYVLDRHMANSYAGEFEDMLSKCRPMMTTYSREENLNEILRCFSQFESDQGSRIQQSSSLSSITLPISLMPIAAGRSDKDETEAIVASLSESADKFRQCLAEYPVIDIHHIAQVEDIKAGKIG